MATIIVRESGRPVSGAKVEVESTYGFSQYDTSCRTNSDGEAYFDDNANRFFVYVNGDKVDTIGKLSGTIHVSI